MNVAALLDLACELLRCEGGCAHPHLGVHTRAEAGAYTLWVVEWRWRGVGTFDFGASGETLEAAAEKALHRIGDGMGTDSTRVKRRLRRLCASSRVARTLVQDLAPPAPSFTMQLDDGRARKRRCACGRVSLDEREYVAGHRFSDCDELHP